MEKKHLNHLGWAVAAVLGVVLVYKFYSDTTPKTSNFSGWAKAEGGGSHPICTALMAQYSHWLALFNSLKGDAGGTHLPDGITPTMVVNRLNKIIDQMNANGCSRHTHVFLPPITH